MAHSGVKPEVCCHLSDESARELGVLLESRVPVSNNALHALPPCLFDQMNSQKAFQDMFGGNRTVSTMLLYQRVFKILEERVGFK